MFFLEMKPARRGAPGPVFFPFSPAQKPEWNKEPKPNTYSRKYVLPACKGSLRFLLGLRRSEYNVACQKASTGRPRYPRKIRSGTLRGHFEQTRSGFPPVSTASLVRLNLRMRICELGSQMQTSGREEAHSCRNVEDQMRAVRGILNPPPPVIESLLFFLPAAFSWTCRVFQRSFCAATPITK